MPREIDTQPMFRALDDESSQVQEAALRVIEVLMPLQFGESELELLRRKTEDFIPEIRDVAERALTKLSKAGTEYTEPTAADEQLVPAWSRSTEPWGTPERWREILKRESDVSTRLSAARELAAIGEAEWLEPVLNEIERHALNIDVIGHVRREPYPLLPPQLVDRFRRIADDESRRGDIRQIAHLLASRSASPDLDHIPPWTPDLVQNAEALAERR